MLTHLTTPEYLLGLLGTAAHIALAVLVLRACFLVVRFTHRHRQP